jgi:hypothetical protein
MNARKILKTTIVVLASLLFIESWLSDRLGTTGKGCNPWKEIVDNPAWWPRNRDDSNGGNNNNTCSRQYLACPAPFQPGTCNGGIGGSQLWISDSAVTCVYCSASSTDPTPSDPNCDFYYAANATQTIGVPPPGYCNLMNRPFDQTSTCPQSTAASYSLTGDGYFSAGINTGKPLDFAACVEPHSCGRRWFEGWDIRFHGSGGTKCFNPLQPYKWIPITINCSAQGCWRIDENGRLTGPPTLCANTPWNNSCHWYADITMEDCAQPPNRITHRAHFESGL